MAEMDELGKRTIDMTNDIQKYNNLSELQDSADATRDNLSEMKEKLSKGIQLLDGLLQDSSVQEGLESSLEWQELPELKSQLCSANALNKAGIEYGDIKADCLQLMDTINQGLVYQLQ